jgi:NAD(P)-dependent dehydrogenase (short-subunit alcohol dehydrogenase family)
VTSDAASDLEWAGRVVVVTGGTSGIGLAVARALAMGGANLMLAARSAEGLAAAVDECRGLGGVVETAVADVSSSEDVDGVRAATVARFGRVDAWVNTAAVVAYGRFEEVPPDTFGRVLDTDLLGSVHVSRAAVSQFRSQRQGTLVLMGSLLGEIATPYMSSYVTAKWAVRGLARVLSIENRDMPGVRVCVVSPAGVDTPIYDLAANYLGRGGRPPAPVDSPEKVAAAVLRCLRDGRPRRSVGPLNLLVRGGHEFTPWLFDLLVGPLMRRLGVTSEPVEPHDGNAFEPLPHVEGLGAGWRFGRSG